MPIFEYKCRGCANEFEACVQNSDCCGFVSDGSGYMCINGHCALPSPIIH